MRQATTICADKRPTHSSESSGQSVVELGLMLPVLALVLIGILDLGRIYYSYITVVNVAREGARYAAAHPPASCALQSDATDIEARARKEAEGSWINPAQLAIFVSCPDDEGSIEQPTIEHPIKVTVYYEFQMISARMLGFPPIRLRSQATMEIFGR